MSNGSFSKRVFSPWYLGLLLAVFVGVGILYGILLAVLPQDSIVNQNIGVFGGLLGGLSLIIYDWAFSRRQRRNTTDNDK